MRCAHEKHWKSETKTTCKERLKLITALISSGDNSKLNGNIALIFSSWTARGFWTRSPLPVFFSSLKRGAGCDVAMTWLWTRRPCGLVVRTELEEPGPCTRSSAHDLFWEHSEAPSLPRASVSLPVREVLTYIPGGRDVQTKPWELSGPWSPLSGKDLCLLVTPSALCAHWVAASCLRFPCQITAKIKREEVAMASTWCLQGRQTGVSGAAQGLGNGGAEAGRELGVLGGDTGGSHTCSRTAPVCGVGVCQPLGACTLAFGLRQDLWEARYCLAAVLCACFRWPAGGRGRSLSQPGGAGPGQRQWQCWEVWALCWHRKVGSQKAGPGRALAHHWVKKLKPLFLPLPLLLSFPSISACPPSRQPFVDTWSFTSSWHSQSLLRGL